MTLSYSRRRRVLAGAATGALATSALLLAPPAQAATITLTQADVNTSATRANGSNTFLADGVRVRTTDSPAGISPKIDKAAGYFDVSKTLSTVATSPAPALAWESLRDDVATKPGLQLKVDFDNDGDVDGILVGEDGFAPNWWLSEGKAATRDAATPLIAAGEPDYRKYYAPLASWSTTFPNAKVVEAGWSLGSGAGTVDGIISNISVGGDSYRFGNSPAIVTKTLYSNDVNQTETRATGSNTFLTNIGGVRVKTTTPTPGVSPSTDKAAGYFPVGIPFAKVGEASLSVYKNGASNNAPSVQLVLDTDGNGTPDSTLVGERTYADGSPLYQGIAGATEWWMTTGSAAKTNATNPREDTFGSGYQSLPYGGMGTLAEWRKALPAATVVAGGWSLGSGVIGDATIESISIGSTKYLFSGSNRAPVVTNGSVSTASGQAVAVPIVATDPDGDTLTYSATATGGTVSGTGAARTFTPAAGFNGTGVVTYTVTDGRGGSTTGTVTVTVAAPVVVPPAPKAASAVDIYRVKPVSGKITTRNTVSVYATVTIGGQKAPSGTVVDVFAKGKKVGTGKVNSSGKVKATLGVKLPKGKSTLKISLPGSATVNGSSDSVAVRVIKK